MPAQPPPPPFVKGAGENELKTLSPWQEPELHEVLDQLTRIVVIVLQGTGHSENMRCPTED